VANQQRAFPDEALTDPISRTRYVLWGALIGRTISGRLGWPIEPALVVVGVAALAWRTWLGWRRTGQPPPEGLVLLAAIAFFAGPSTSIHLAWPRYVLPSLLVGSLLSGLGLAALIQLVSTAIRAGGRPRRLADRDQAQAELTTSTVG